MHRALFILASLVAGLLAGMAVGNSATSLGELADITGSLWLNALRMTVLPLVIALLITGIVQTANAASAGRLAGRSIAFMLVLLFVSSCLGAAGMLSLLDLFPAPEEASIALRSVLDSPADAITPPHISDFVRGILPTNIFAAAADDAMLPVILFTVLVAFALLRLPEGQRAYLTNLFEALGNAMIILVGWVLWVAPLGVFALAFSLGQRAGGAAFGGLAHYVALLVTIGAIIWMLAVTLATVGGRMSPVRFLRASVPAQAVALSTQSSLASLPAMFTGMDDLGTRRGTSEIVLPIAVAIFRVTSPAFNLGVAFYIAHWLGMELSAWHIATGIAVATVTTLGSVSLPGSVSFIGSIAPICLAIGLPIEPLALLVAIETFPDIMRTVANVTMDMALTATVDERLSSLEN